MADRYWVGGTGAWSDVSTANWSTATGLSFTASRSLTTLTTVGSPALVAGMTVWGSTHTNLGTIVSGSGNTWVMNTSGTVTSQDMSAATVGASVPTATDSVFFDANSNSGTSIFTVTMSVTPRVCNDFTASGLDGVMTLAGSGIGLTVSGSLTFPATNFSRTHSGTNIFNATTTGKTITTNGVTFGNVTFDGVGGGWTLGGAFTVSGATNTTTLTNGTLDIQSYTLSTGRFNSNNSNTRTIAFGTGQISCTGTGTVWTTATVTGLTTTGTQVVNVTSVGSTGITVNAGALSEADSISFNFTGGTYALQFPTTGSGVKNVNFTGYAGAWTQNGSATFYGNLTIASGMTLTPTTGAGIVFGATSGTKTITSNAISFPSPYRIDFNGVGGTFQLQDALTVLANDVFLINGTLDLFGKTLTAGTSFRTSTGTKNLTFNGGTILCSAATTTAFNNSAPTGFTTTAGTGTGTISMTAATAKTFVGGGSTFNCTLNQGGAGALTITGSNTFTSISNSVQPTTFTFTAGTTTTVTNWNVNGTAGNLVTIGSATAASHTLSKASGTVSSDYLSISRSTATGGASWYAGANSTNGGNNSGWIFTAPPSVTATGNFLVFF